MPWRTILPSTVHLAALSYLLAVIVVVVSERVFWFWAPSLVDHLVLAAFYSLPTMVAILVVSRFRVDTVWSLLLVAPVFAFVVEGVLTPVIYTGGPFVPLFPAWFTLWHGVLALVVGVFVVRAWLLERRIRDLALASVGLGGFWGVWASTLRLPENVEDEDMVADLGDLVVLDPIAFARYATMVTLVLATGHLLLDRLWPDHLARNPLAERIVATLVAVGVIGWTSVVPWALPMFALSVGVVWRALRWHREASRAQLGAAGPDLFVRLRGDVSPLATVPLLLLAPTASVTYAILWSVDPSDLVLRTLMYGTIGAQALAGAALTVAAFVRARRCRPVVVRSPGRPRRRALRGRGTS